MAQHATATTRDPKNDANQTAPQGSALLTSTSLTSGTTKAPGITEAQRSNIELRPVHSYTQSTLAPTSEFTRYILLALPARYFFRSIFESLFMNENAYDRFQRPINDWIQRSRVDPLVTKLDAVIKDHPLPRSLQNAVCSAPHRENAVELMRDYLEKNGEGKALQGKLTKILDKHGALGKYANGHDIFPFALTRTDSHGALSPQITTKSHSLLRNALRSNAGQIGYGMALGTSMLGLTISYSRNVYKDMQHLYSEAVAYETGKKPEDVTLFDLFKSENKIVNATTHNFWMKLGERVLLSVPFFLVGKMLPMGLADFTIGLTGMRLLTETWNRKPTMFEDLVTFVNQKINPQNGLGQPITVSDVFDIYQHYCYYNQPEKGFHNVISTNNEEAKNWSESHVLFSRIAELMNHSYAYKHTTQYDADGNVLKLADFLLPKFIYLLGHGLIDAKHPEKSVTYVEIANAQGIDAVKRAQAEFAAGKTNEEVQQAHGLKPSAIATMRKQAPAKETAMAEAQADSLIPKPTKPEPHVASASLQHAGAVQPAARRIS